MRSHLPRFGISGVPGVVKPAGRGTSGWLLRRTTELMTEVRDPDSDDPIALATSVAPGRSITSEWIKGQAIADAASLASYGPDAIGDPHERYAGIVRLRDRLSTELWSDSQLVNDERPLPAEALEFNGLVITYARTSRFWAFVVAPACWPVQLTTVGL